MMAFIKFMNDSGFVGWVILFTGIGCLALVAERIYFLYLKYSLDADGFMKKIQSLILARKTEEALIACNTIENKPLARAFKVILEKSDRDDNTIFQAHDIAMSEIVPLYTRRLHYLGMLANVATLLGLLGTIHGLILSFEAVASADPAQKQALLANGISVSMYTTALGLGVAIPAMVMFSFLHSKQNELIEQATEKCGKLTELLTSSFTGTMDRRNVYPELTPPPSAEHKAS